MKLFPKMNIMNKLEMKLGLSKSILKIVLITMLLALVIYGVSNYYNCYFKNVLESYNQDDVRRRVEAAMEDAIEDTTSSLEKNLEEASEEVGYAMEKAIKEIEDEIASQ